jgi:hypothetical protein
MFKLLRKIISDLLALILGAILYYFLGMSWSDLQLQEGKPARSGICWQLKALAPERLAPFTRDQMLRLLAENFSPHCVAQIERDAQVSPSL